MIQLMPEAVLEILDPGLAAAVQDTGRWGWRRFGVPPSGSMDGHAATWANRLLDNPTGAPVLELLLQGARLAVRHAVWMAITGADADANVATWRALRLSAGETIQFPRNRSGVWIYLAVENGFDVERWFGSASVYARGGLGKPLARGDTLRRAAGPAFQLPPGIGGRLVDPSEHRHYDSPPLLRVWPGPQWSCFSESDRAAFFTHEWALTSQCDRVGYRLAGARLRPAPGQIISEPVRVGAVQVPEGGSLIVIMRDGPTVGGYPKIGVIDPADLSWLAQCRAGQKVRFRPVGRPDGDQR